MDIGAHESGAVVLLKSIHMGPKSGFGKKERESQLRS